MERGQWAKWAQAARGPPYRLVLHSHSKCVGALGSESQMCHPEASFAGWEEKGVGLLAWRERPVRKGHSPQGFQVEATGGGVRNDARLPVWGPSE